MHRHRHRHRFILGDKIKTFINEQYTRVIYNVIKFIDYMEINHYINPRICPQLGEHNLNLQHYTESNCTYVLLLTFHFRSFC